MDERGPGDPGNGSKGAAPPEDVARAASPEDMARAAPPEDVARAAPPDDPARVVPLDDLARAAPPDDPARAALRRYWGHGAFRPGQAEIIADVLAGRDVLAVLPTGWGKSICYQVPAVLSPGLTLVISPLVALMADQVTGLGARGVPATFLNATLTVRESERRWDDLIAGRYRLLYIAPERLGTERFRARSERLRIDRIAVDEAHCVSEWGHDFRPDYLQIAAARAYLGGVPIVAVTATATPAVRRDVTRLLALRRPAVHVRGFDRPNIVWSAFRDPDKAGRLAEVLGAVRGPGIVYASSRAGTESWAVRLRAAGESVSVYHAGRPAEDRAKAQDEWARGRSRVMVATSAFGMGIDRSDVRLVAHVDLPPTLEAYYQEAGRAGRDGRPAHAVLLWSDADVEAGRRRIATEHPSASDVRAVFEVACSMAGIAVSSGSDDPFAVDVARVAAVTGLDPGPVRRAVELVERQGAWMRVASREGEGLLRLRGEAGSLDAYVARLGARGGAAAEGGGASAALLRVAELLARSPIGTPDDWMPVDTADWARRLAIGQPLVELAFQMLQERDLVTFLPPGRSDRYRLVGVRPKRLQVDGAAARRAKRRAAARFGAMVRYVSSRGCRRHGLLSWFGEGSPARCGRCDVCLGRHEPFVALPAHEDLLRAMLASAAVGRDPESAPEVSRLPAWKRRALVDWLVHRGWLEPDDTSRGAPAITREGRRKLDLTDSGRPPGDR